MSSNYESNNMTATSLEAMIQANGQAMEVREQVPYRPVVYALPEEWLNAEMGLLKNASEFQPELYRLIYQRATRQEFQQMQEQQRMELREQASSIRSTLQQDGSVREKYSSELSKMLSDSLRAMETVTSNLQKKIMKILIATAVSSVALSVLVCTVWHLLVG